MKRSLLTLNVTVQCGCTAAVLERLTAMSNENQARLDQVTTALNGAADRITAGLDGVRQDIADLKASNPAVDFTALDASVARIAGEADSLTALDGETPAPQV